MKKWAVLCLLLMFSAGCGAEMTEGDGQKQYFLKTEQAVAESTLRERAGAIKDRLQQIEGVSSTAVVVEGHTAIIGLRLEEGVEQMTADRVKQEAEAAAKGAAVSVERVSVTANSYIVGMIEEMERKRADD